MNRAIVLFSGGKDSVYATHLSLLKGFEIVLLVTFIPKSKSPWTIHRPLAEYSWLSAKSIGINHISIPVISIDRGGEEKEIRRSLEEIIERYDIDYIVLGVLGSYAQRMFFQEIAEDIGVDLYTPLWGRDREQYLLELISNGIEFIITSITTWGLPPSKFLGKIVSRELAMEILRRAKTYGFDPCFEGGEAETFVVNAPLYRFRLCINAKPVIVSDTEGYIEPLDIYGC